MESTAIIYLVCTSVGVAGSLLGASVMIAKKLKKKYKLKLEQKIDKDKIKEEVIQEALKTLKELKDKDEFNERSFRDRINEREYNKNIYPEASGKKNVI